MLKFFRKISEFESSNKMTGKNLGICFSPCFLRRDPGHKDPKILNVLVLNSVVLAKCMEVLINYAEELFPEDEESKEAKRVMKQKTVIMEELRMYDENEENNKVFLKRKK